MTAPAAVEGPEMDGVNEIERFLLQQVMWEQGIIPMDLDDHDAGRRLDLLPPEEARRLKRRFRKLWRTLARTKAYHSLYGLGDKEPSRRTKNHRKVLVFYHCWQVMMEKKRQFECKTGGD